MRKAAQAQADMGTTGTGMANGKACLQEAAREREVIECRKCTAGACSHGAQCSMMIRWYDDPWDGTFWRRCECTAWTQATVHPVTVTRSQNHCHSEAPERGA